MRDPFLPQRDELGTVINQHAAELYSRLKTLDVEALQLPDHCLYYFRNSHFNRLFFSIETSAHLLYRSIQMVGKPVRDIIIMDYGAGVGTLYMLAKMIGCKNVVYNDFLPEWKFSAMQIANGINVSIDEYVLGDIEDTLETLRQKDLRCDIITSRNVIEHVYDLAHFYRAICNGQPSALVYSSTTANFYNPAAHIKHVLWHRKWEKEYFQRRIEIIAASGLVKKSAEQRRLARKTQGLARNDLSKAIGQFVANGEEPDPGRHYTNCCQPDTGVWAEHLLTFRQYREFIENNGYRVSFLPGFWDTHYSIGWKNALSALLNGIIRAIGKPGIILAPFIYVVANPTKR